MLCDAKASVYVASVHCIYIYVRIHREVWYTYAHCTYCVYEVRCTNYISGESGDVINISIIVFVIVLIIVYCCLVFLFCYCCKRKARHYQDKGTYIITATDAFGYLHIHNYYNVIRMHSFNYCEKFWKQKICTCTSLSWI